MGALYGSDLALDSENETRTVRLISAATIRPVETAYVLAPYIPRGEVTWLEGITKSGKTFCALDLIARGTRGEAHPLTNEPIAATRAAILTCEDSPNHTIIPRLIAASADRERVSIVRVEDTASGEGRVPSFLRDLDGLEARLRDEGVDLLLIDGSFGVLGAVDGNDYAESYRVMLPVVGMIRNLHIGALMLRHTRKSDAHALHRGVGSVGYASLGRSTISVAIDRDDETGQRRIWAHAGSNVGETGPTLAFSIEDAAVEDFIRPVGRVRWLEVVEGLRADDLDRSRAPEDAAERDVAEEWLCEYLKGPTPAKEIFEASDRYRIPKRTIQRVAKRLGVLIERRGFGEGSVWSPPSQASIRVTGPHSRQPSVSGTNGANGGLRFPDRLTGGKMCLSCHRIAITRERDQRCPDCIANEVQ